MTRHIILSNRPEPLPRWLEAFPEAEFVNFATLGDERLAALSPALFWLHVASPESPMVEDIRRVLRVAKGFAVVVLANIAEPAHGYLALRAGAAGYASALAAPELLRQIEVVVGNGGIWTGAELKQRLLEALAPFVPNPDAAHALDRLSPRQREVAEAVARGASNKEVARTLNITERTVKAHLSTIFELTGARDRMQLALLLNKPRAVDSPLKTGTHD